MRCVDLYNQSQSKWFEEMVTTSLVRNHHSVCWRTILLGYNSTNVIVNYCIPFYGRHRAKHML